jgi:Low-density lipoprotein receptor domain class A
VVDCPFGDDESNCGCGDEMFECHSSKKCIPLKWRCDSFNDCLDKSDETNCSQDNQISTSKPKVDCEEFTCSSGDCVLFTKVCNGKPHCIDGSDEGGQCGNNILLIYTIVWCYCISIC